MEDSHQHSGRKYLRHKFKSAKLFHFRRKRLFSRWILGEISDVSKGGIGFRCLSQFELSIDEPIEIRLGHRVLKGKVRYSKKEGVDRKIGVEFCESLSISDLYSLNVTNAVATGVLPPKSSKVNA